MKNNLRSITLASLLIVLLAPACEKKYSFGQIITPASLAITTTIQGATTASPSGDGSGNVTITATATNALAYKFYFGTGDSLISNTGTVTYKYTTLDTNQYTIVVNAIGTGGAMSTVSKQIKVYYLFQIPAAIDAALTGGTSKTWSVAHDSAGNFGVGPTTSFTPDYYSSAPNEKPSCAYGSVITFTHVSANNISINVNNQGSSFIIGAATAFYGQSGGDGCYGISTGGTKTATFGTDAFAGSNSSNSTGIQITVPGNGIINFGTGANTYEVLFLSSKVMTLRAIGVDGLAWYTVLKAN
ncbi:MAG TPA: hypothetical protein VGM30_02125 [Puia sp.]|jgi:hypothetical protein